MSIGDIILGLMIFIAGLLFIVYVYYTKLKPKVDKSLNLGGKVE